MEEEASSSKQSNNNDSDGQRKYNRNQKGSQRFKPYYGSQKEGQGFADLRKKKAAREYLKFLSKEKKNEGALQQENTHKPPLKLFDILSRSDKQVKGNSYSRVERIAEEKRKEQEVEREKFLEEKEAKQTAMKAYKAKKKERFLKLCKKTRKGQPVMKNQMEVLLEKVMKHKGMNTETKDSKG